MSMLLRNGRPGSHARALELSLWNSPSLLTMMRNRIPPFQGMGASLGPVISASSSPGVQGPRGDFWIPGLLGAPRGEASNFPNELISIRSQGPSEGLTVPAFILASSSPVPDSVGYGRVRGQGPSPLCEVAQENTSFSQPESPPPPVSGTPASAARSSPPSRATEECHSLM